VEGLGKQGLVIDIDEEGNGYFISFNITNGSVNLRTWGFNPLNSRENFIFREIQSGHFTVHENKSFWFKVIRYGNYIELSIDGLVKLTLIDYTFSGNLIGLLSASSLITLQSTVVYALPDPPEEYASQGEAQKLSD
jgi:beta-fructofuranosidase